MLVKRGCEALRECESRLRGLLAEAAAAGDYEAALQLTEWARAVAALEIARSSPNAAGQDSSFTAHHQGDGADRTSASATTPRKKSTRRRSKKGVLHAQRKRKAVATYPKFARLQNELVKIGWSKKGKKEYQHKAPRQVIDLLLDRVIEVGASGSLFTTEDVFPLHGNDDSEVPSYQAYLALAWLKRLGLLVQHGRQGYALARTTSMKPLIETEWADLCTR
jgi:hypothetical protein